MFTSIHEASLFSLRAQLYEIKIMVATSPTNDSFHQTDGEKSELVNLTHILMTKIRCMQCEFFQ